MTRVLGIAFLLAALVVALALLFADTSGPLTGTEW
jgi:hypothetical protein